MDFFNSIQYGRKPYTTGVIYPPLINLIYAANCKCKLDTRTVKIS